MLYRNCDLENTDTGTARAFITVYRKYDELLREPRADSTVDFDEEITWHLIAEPIDYDQSIISITVIEDEQALEDVKTAVSELNLTILEEKQECGESEQYGEYTGYSLVVTATECNNEDWNVPHLVVYGSLTPVREACSAAFGGDIGVANIQNHYVVYGDALSNFDNPKTRLHDSISANANAFKDEIRDLKSSVSSSSYLV